MDLRGLPLAEFGFPGELRDRLVEAILDGSKTSTTSRAIEYAVDGEKLPDLADLYAVPDSSGRIVAVIEVTEVRLMRLQDVDLRHVIDEGENDGSVKEWRRGHTLYWEGPEMREFMGDAHVGVDDDTELILERFKVVERF
jgi:uncharacterized protein YhfF